MRQFIYLPLLIIVAFLAGCNTSTTEVSEKAAYVSPLSIKGLQQRVYNATLTNEKELTATDEYTAHLMSYFSDSLKIYTLINTPSSVMPEGGYPVLIFGHGFHPEPKKYGVSNETGKDWRPGDYYRGVPESFAAKGFLTITPDYRGHNISDGFEFTKTSYLASTYYAIDVLHLIAALGDLENANLDKVYYLGHSMGGDVGLKVLLATDKINAASLWAPVAGSTWEQALYYGKYYDENGELTDTETMKKYMARLDTTIQKLRFEHNINEGDPINYIKDLNTPLVIHHARWESSVPYAWSESLAAHLYEYQKPFEFYAYTSENHLFKDENREKAITRDIQFFNHY